MMAMRAMVETTNDHSNDLIYIFTSQSPWILAEGQSQLPAFPVWKNSQQIFNTYSTIYVLPRKYVWRHL